MEKTRLFVVMAHFSRDKACALCQAALDTKRYRTLRSDTCKICFTVWDWTYAHIESVSVYSDNQFVVNGMLTAQIGEFGIFTDLYMCKTCTN
jgi:hypothetical protein